MHKYDDMLYMDKPPLRFHTPMPAEERAAQFAPFAALTGFDEVIDEAARLTADRVALSEDARAELNRGLQALAERIETSGEPVQTELTWFEPDGLKLGGRYRTGLVCVRRVDPVYQLLELADYTAIRLEELLELHILE